MAAVDDALLAQVFRDESGRCIATLVRAFGDIDLAEDAVQDAFAVASVRWPVDGLPANPGAWITTTARNRAIDRLRREGTRDARQRQAMLLVDDEPPPPVGPVTDDRLRLIFTCCHPALAAEAQVALTLRLLGGLSTPEIARAFLVPEPTMAQRIVRAKRKIKANHLPYRIPADHDLPDRLGSVLLVVYLIFNEGYAAASGDDLVRAELCAEAVRLARLLVELMPDEPEAIGLLALLLLTESRRPARTDGDGRLVVLADQDRGMWDQALVAEGQDLVRRRLRRNHPGRYQLQAAIAAVHSDAASVEETDWAQVVALYDQLFARTPTAVVALNRAVARAEVDGPEAALADLDLLAADLDGYHLFHATRGDLLRRLGRADEAAAAFGRAASLATNAAERIHLEGRIGDRQT